MATQQMTASSNDKPTKVVNKSFNKNKKSKKTKEELRKERILGIAVSEGLTYGFLATAMVGGGFGFAHYQYPSFRQAKMTSIKVGLPIMAGLFSFALVSELSINDMKRNPGNYNLIININTIYNIFIKL